MEQYFTIDGVEIHYKTYIKENKIMVFYGKDLLIASIRVDVESNYSWAKCKKLYGD